jgi:hypothetical protein
MINEYYTLKAGSEVFSIALQESVKFTRDVVVKITDSAVSNGFVFGNVQLKFENIALSAASGQNMSSYVDKANGDISLNFSDLKKLN